MRFMTGFLGIFLLSCSGPNGFTSKTDSSGRKSDNAADASASADGQRSEASNEAASNSANAGNTADGSKGGSNANNGNGKKSDDAKSTPSVSSGNMPICIWPPNKEYVPIALGPISKLKIDQCQVTVKTREGTSLTPDAAKDRILDSKTLVNIDLKTLIVAYQADRSNEGEGGHKNRYYETAITCKDQAAVKLVVFVPHSMEGVKEACNTVDSSKKESYDDDHKDK